MSCARIDRVLAFALSTLLVCGVINTAVAVIEQAWWLWGVGGACLTAATIVARGWLPPPHRQRLPHVTEKPDMALFDHDDINATV
jgi:hypothetical protein